VVAEHEEAMKLFTGEAAKGIDADLKRFADTTLPTVREHFVMAHTIVEMMKNNKQKVTSPADK
jgi:predicted outer membrane protein